MLKIASYNIRKAVGLDWKRDPARILGILGHIDADVVMLQEADKRLGNRPAALPRFLIDQETDYEVVDLAPNDVSLGFHGNAVLVRRGLEVGEAKTLDLPGLEPRGAVHVDVSGLSIVGTHLGLLRSWRHRQMRAILNHLGEGTEGTVIAGDFNEWFPHRGFEPWDGIFRRVEPGPSFHATFPVRSLDAIAYGSGLRVEDSGVVTTAVARRASDHLPIWAVLGHED